MASADTPDLAGKTALVTGASRGIGLAIAQRLAARGANVCVTARKPEPLAEAAATLGPAGRVLAVAGRADDPDHQQEAVARTIATFGSLDLLVNNAGINPSFGLLMDVDLGAARKTLEVNVLGTLAWTQVAHRAWLGEHGGSVVNVASFAGIRTSPGIAFYGATKAAVINLTQQMAVELSPRVRVNAVAPAVVQTRFAEALYRGNEDRAAAVYPLKRLGVPEDVAAAVVFLLSDDAAWITGHTLVVDGGLLLGAGIGA
jgi:NAD(P)-dependent dehydrogenase (short-subunit alcohol dehydrogenase family)